jgi:hypothetical protein
VTRFLGGANGVQVKRPPAFETAAASSGVAALPMGAWTSGALSPSMRQKGVGKLARFKRGSADEGL